MNLNWFLSSTVREATHMRKHVWKILSAQRDILSPNAISAVESAVESMRAVCTSGSDKATVQKEMTSLETVANQWLKPYPNAGLRENVEVLLVAIAVAMAIRTFFAQPFKIPTGSMQPTLYGVTSTSLSEGADFEMPPVWKRYFLFWFSGESYDEVIAESDGEFRLGDETPKKLLLFNLKQTFHVGNDSYRVMFPAENLLRRAGLVDNYGAAIPRKFKKGDTVLKLKSYSGDHLFVDRLTYNFRRPQRGEIIVFETQNIEGMQADQRGNFYIKRLVGLENEKLRIGDDRHLYVNGQRIDAGTPHFKSIYSFDPAKAPTDSTYSGHVNGRYLGYAARYFPDDKTEFTIPDKHLMAMGDNTMNSSDSRYWGSLPRDSVIGRSLCVYWPFGAQDGRRSRFGLTRE
jgi:signal peptidase I